jgi:Concanavalin A-like lectin/glucanases superfamily
VSLNTPFASVRAGLFALALFISAIISCRAPAAESVKTTPPAPAADKPGIQVAGELVVGLDARDPSAGSKVWTNQGSMGHFSRLGAPKRTTLGGQPAVQFNGTNDAYRSEKPTAATITGDHARTIEVWVYNESLDSPEECLVAWGHRGGTLTNMAFNYGSGGGFSAVTHYDQDMGWGEDPPAAGRWHHLVYTYDGTVAKIYDNAVERGSQEFKLATAPDDRLNIAVENSAEGEPLFFSEWDSPWALTLSGGIALVRVHSGALTPAQIKSNFSADKARFGAAAP